MRARRLTLLGIVTVCLGVALLCAPAARAQEAPAAARFIPLPVFRYGHCAFTVNELLTGLGVLAVQP